MERETGWVQARGEAQEAAKAEAAGRIAGATDPVSVRRAPLASQGLAAQRNPGFFRRFCLGVTSQPGTTTNTRPGGILSAIDDLQRQIDALKNSTDK